MAIAGIGVDTAAVYRLEKSLLNPRFLQRVYGPEEQRLVAEKGPATAAANFAAKEAFGKALGTGILREFSLDEVQALRNADGAPYLAFSGRAQALMEQRGLRAHLSLTHEEGLATAFVLLEEKKEQL